MLTQVVFLFRTVPRRSVGVLFISLHPLANARGFRFLEINTKWWIKRINFEATPKRRFSLVHHRAMFYLEHLSQISLPI